MVPYLWEASKACNAGQRQHIFPVGGELVLRCVQDWCWAGRSGHCHHSIAAQQLIHVLSDPLPQLLCALDLWQQDVNLLNTLSTDYCQHS